MLIASCSVIRVATSRSPPWQRSSVISVPRKLRTQISADRSACRARCLIIRSAIDRDIARSSNRSWRPTALATNNEINGSIRWRHCNLMVRSNRCSFVVPSGKLQILVPPGACSRQIARRIPAGRAQSLPTATASCGARPSLTAHARRLRFPGTGRPCSTPWTRTTAPRPPPAPDPLPQRRRDPRASRRPNMSHASATAPSPCLPQTTPLPADVCAPGTRTTAQSPLRAPTSSADYRNIPGEPPKALLFMPRLCRPVPRQRILEWSKSPAATHRMGEHLATEDCRAACAERKWLSEAPNGWIKEALGFCRFCLRGQKKVQGEWSLVCLATEPSANGDLHGGLKRHKSRTESTIVHDQP